MSVQTQIENGVGIIVIDNPPVNALSQDVAQGILSAFETLESNDQTRSIVITANGRTFVAGADVKRFQQMIEEGDCEQGAGLYDLTSRIENSPKPVVCALFGTTLGGGLELAMACHYRIALAGSKIGQPEVKLGLIPGAGGTQRLPRLCGLAKAAEIIGFGDPLTVEEGKECGIIDEVVTGDLRESSVEFALRKSNDGPRPTKDLDDKLQFDADVRTLINDVRMAAMERYQGAMASFHALDAVEKSGELSFEDGLAIEKELFVKSLSSDEARNLIYLFFAEREAGKIPAVKTQESFQAANTVGFPGLFSDDVGILEQLIKSKVELQIVDRDDLLNAKVDFLFLREVPESDSNQPELSTEGAPIVVDTSEFFQPSKIAEMGFDESQIVGLRFWPGKSNFAEIGITDSTSPYAIKSIIQLLKRLECSFVVERPAPHYASNRIREHRFDESDLKIEVWKLVQEKNIERASDIDLIQIHCYGQPRHKSNVGMK